MKKSTIFFHLNTSITFNNKSTIKKINNNNNTSKEEKNLATNI